MLQLSCYKVWEGLGSWSLFQNFHPTLPTHIRQLQTGWKSWLYKYAHLKAEKDTVDNMSHQINTAENKKQTYIIGLKQLGHSKEGFSSFHDTKVLPLEDIWKEGNPSYHNQLWACCRCLCIGVNFLSLTWFMRYRILVRIWAHFRGFMGVSLNTRAWKQSTDKDADTNTSVKTLSCLVLATDTNNTL